MMNKKKADKLFQEAMMAVHAAGEDRVNYCLSFVRGYLDSVGKTEILHEWDDGTMRVKITIGEQVH
ncbi:hypothetical protein [Enterobacter oligotrophicus]|uniref:hypothetical protein n=1 Tax=Enterobacter oligotrophicus TaxID=2478464 RepID=UPI0028AB6961|nr:hypothetical protein [Enterobacter oligotrophicus]